MKRIAVFIFLCALASYFSCSKSGAGSNMAKEAELMATVSFLVGDVKIEASGAVNDSPP